MIRKILPTQADRIAMSSIGEFKKIKNDNYDYSKVIVNKPWGYEYLIFQNEHVGIWILYLKEGAQTSMHCHPGKKTSLFVLQGEVKCLGIDNVEHLYSGEAIIIERAVFHRTIALSTPGAFLLELETPVDKTDLIRLKDEYGRERLGYEGEEHYSRSTQNYNYLSFSSADLKHNFIKKIGDHSLNFYRIENQVQFEKLLIENHDNVLFCLNKDLINNNDLTKIEVGDAILGKNLNKLFADSYIDYLEFMVLRKSDHIVKVSDYVSQFIKNFGLNNIFLVAGEANIHLIDSIGRQEGIQFKVFSNEKSASLAAEAYSKTTNEVAILVVSSGASSIAAIPGVMSAWSDAVPMLIISGQAHTTFCNENLLKQNGNKSVNIVEIVRPFTKYSQIIMRPCDIIFHLNKAMKLAKSGRPGPVWIDIPLDVQGMEFNLKTKIPMILDRNLKDIDGFVINDAIDTISSLIKASKRPVILAGLGVKRSKAENEFLEFVSLMKIPVLLTRSSADLLDEKNQFYFGRPGGYGQRHANFIIQNSDLLISIGSRLSMVTTGRNIESFARGAIKVVISQDQDSVDSMLIKPNFTYVVNIKEFLLQSITKNPNGFHINKEWIKNCDEWQTRYADVYAGHNLSKSFNAIYAIPLIKKLSSLFMRGDVISVDGGLSLTYFTLSFEFKRDQKLICSDGLESVGIALPSAIGAALGLLGRKIICICELTTMEMHTQDLEIIKTLNLPIKILLFKGVRKSLLRGIQKDYFGKRYIGTDFNTLGNNFTSEIAKLYDFSVFEIKQWVQVDEILNKWYLGNDPSICEIEIEDDYEFLPKPGFQIKEDQTWIAKPLEDQYPYLPREELIKNMIIPLDDE